MKRIDPGIFKAYDIRGTYPDQIDEEIFYKIGQAYAKFMNFSGGEKVFLGRDVRISGLSLAGFLKRGLLDHGVDVVDIGVVTTDMMYFAVVHGKYEGGLIVTGSHTPREYNGIKIVRKKAVPVSGDTGIMDIRDLVLSGYAYKAKKQGSERGLDVLDEYINKVLSIVDYKKFRPFKIVANINFGSLAANLRRLQNFLPLEIIWLNEEPDGTFPKGRPDPLIPESRQETIDMVKNSIVDFAAAWDADADRCYFYDETGRFLSGYFTCAVLSDYFLKKYPKSKVVIDMKQNWAIKDAVVRAGGIALPNRTGHSLYKERMIAEDAVFGGEVSGHFYFKDYFYLDNGLIPLLVIMDILSASNKRLSEIYQPFFDKYFAIEETNMKVKDVDMVLQAVKNKYVGGQLSEIDGISMDFADWRFNLRPSNTEPLIRLNLEAKSANLRDEKLREIMQFISSLK